MAEKLTTKFSRTELESPTQSNNSDTDINIADPKLTRKILFKCDLHLIPILGCLYLVSFLDRSNIANARLLGLEKTLHMPSNGFNNCLWIFYVPFVLIEIPSNLVLSFKSVKPRMVLGTMMFLLGIVSMCQGLTKTYHGLLACRFIMGALEAGLMPGAALLISQYYTRHEFPIRFALFLCFALAGNAFSGFLAYLIEKMAGASGYLGWQWVFILEGILTFCFGAVAFFTIPEFPERAGFLSDEERGILLAKLQADRGSEKENEVKVNYFRVLIDWKIWVFTILFFCCDMGASSIASFAPTILAQLGWTNSQAQVMSIPIWLIAIFFCLLSSFLAGHYKLRYPFILFGISLAIVGWTVNLAQVNPPSVRYFGLFAIASGTFIQMPILTGWLSGNLRGRRRQAVATAVQLGLGNGANFLSANVFIAKQAPKYPTGFATGLGVTVAGLVLCVGTILVLAILNRGRAGKRDSEGEEDGKDYRYVL